MIYPSAILTMIFGPVRIEVSGNRNIVTHLQKYSPLGFLITWPFCFHIWLFWTKQQGNDQIGWIPGTEQGIYCRTPGYRWDAQLGMKWTWGYIGGHWD